MLNEHCSSLGEGFNKLNYAHELKSGLIRMPLPSLLEFISIKLIMAVTRERRFSGAVDSTP